MIENLFEQDVSTVVARLETDGFSSCENDNAEIAPASVEYEGHNWSRQAVYSKSISGWERLNLFFKMIFQKIALAFFQARFSTDEQKGIELNWKLALESKVIYWLYARDESPQEATQREIPPSDAERSTSLAVDQVVFENLRQAQEDPVLAQRFRPLPIPPAPSPCRNIPPAPSSFRRTTSYTTPVILSPTGFCSSAELASRKMLLKRVKLAEMRPIEDLSLVSIFKESYHIIQAPQYSIEEWEGDGNGAADEEWEEVACSEITHFSSPNVVESAVVEDDPNNIEIEMQAENIKLPHKEQKSLGYTQCLSLVEVLRLRRRDIEDD